MLHILLLILKIIGFTLLAILGIALFLLFIILFVPVKYRVEANTSDGVKRLNVVGKASWFFHLISATFSYKNGLKWQAHIAWRHYPRERKQCNDETCENVTQEDKNKTVTHETSTQENKTEETKTQKNKTQKHNSNLFDKLKCTIQSIYDKIKKIWEMKEQIVEFLTDEIHIGAFQSLKREIMFLAKKLHPKKLQGFVHYGLDDPYNTGQVLAGLSVLYPFYGDDIKIYPDFEKSIIEGQIVMKGHIRLLHILIPIVKLYFDDNIKNTYNDYKRRR